MLSRASSPSSVRGFVSLALTLVAGGASAAEAGFDSVRLGEDLGIREFAGPQHFTNATAFAVDEAGRVFLAEDGRPSAAALNASNFTNALAEALSLRSIEDRAAFLRERIESPERELPANLAVDLNEDGRTDLADFEMERHNIRLIEDRDSDGRADRSRVYTRGFNSFLSGRVSGLLARGGELHVACVPDLWLLNDADGDDEIDDSASLHHGFGVRLPNDRRDMTGPVLAPDGRIYWAIGDRGSRVETPDIIFETPETGAVYRSEPDGSNLELFATGFHNPRGLAFNEVGDLFLLDSGSDDMDEARLIHVAEAGDYGWRAGWRLLPDAGPWKLEQLGGLETVNTGRHVLPPVLRIGNRPGGLAWHDGIGLPETFAGRLLVADAANAGRIHAVKLKPKGASYARADNRDLARNLAASDLQIAPGGEVLVLGATSTNKTEQLWQISSAKPGNQALARETREVLAKRMEGRSVSDLAELLDHPSQRVRIEAQLELVERCTKRRLKWKALEVRLGGGKAFATLSRTARRGPTRTARLHALWALAQIRRLAPKNSLIDLAPLLGDRDAEVRAQMARVAGETLMPGAYEPVVKLLQDPEPRVRYLATISLARFRDPRAVTPIVSMLRENQDEDPLLRHAGAVALASIGGPNRLLAAAHDADAAVRIAAALAMRRLADPGITLFLNDSDEAISREAARAIYDLPIEADLRILASRVTQLRFSNASARRIVNACRLEGDSASARGLSDFAASDLVSEEQRVEALNALRDWNSQSPIDPVTGSKRVISLRRDNLAPAEHLAPHLPRLLFTGQTNVRIAAAEAAAALQIQAAGESFEGLLADKTQNLALRIACLEGLATLDHPLLSQALDKALNDPAKALAETARKIQAKPPAP